MRAPWIDRCAGVLLHAGSLPSGRLDDDAPRFLDLIAQAGLRVWQFLPVSPGSRPHRPFEPASAFAGDPALVAAAPAAGEGSYESFCSNEAGWLDDWALFSALKARFGPLAWWDWPEKLRRRESLALDEARRELAQKIEHARREQYRFDQAWSEFRRMARRRGVLLFGDVPMFISLDSADVWTRRELFEVDADGRCGAFTGVPPDDFNAKGQWWGMPGYRWDAMAADGYRWWQARFAVQARRFDLLRIDHFRGLAQWWRIPPDARSAAEGAWTAGPGRAVIDVLAPVLAGTRLVAEDLGVITEDVVALRLSLGLPGMRVLQFAFDGNPRNPHLPHHHGLDSVCYTGTHDNDTALGWWRAAPAAVRQALQRHIGREPRLPDDLIECAWSSPAPLAIVPMQDLLRLGSEARMNRPGVAEGNWHWRFAWEQVPAPLAAELRQALRRQGRAS